MASSPPLVAILIAAAAPGACSRTAATANGQGEQPAPRQAAAPARTEAPPCPPEELSCGLQTPVVANGRRRFVNAEMGLSAVFPAGSRVCMSRSGNAARGFYAWYGTTEPGCPERGDIAATSMGIGSSFNAAFFPSIRDVVGSDCRPLAGNVDRLLRQAPLAIPGHRSLTCQRPQEGEKIEIMVYAMTGRWPRDFNQDAPRMIYWASLGTNAERLERDLRMFRTFLGNLRIGLPN